MHLYSVGELYHPDKRSWPEVTQIRITPNGIEFLLFFANLQNKDIRALKYGSKDFGLYTEGDQILWLSRIEGLMDWSDSPYCIHKTPREEWGVPEHQGKRLLVNTVLVEATTGIIQGLQATSVTGTFVDILKEAVEKQAALPFDPAAYERNLQHLFSQNTVSDLVKKARIVETAGKI